MIRTFPLLVLVLALAIMASLCVGATILSPIDVFQLIARGDAQDFVVWQHRLPRTLIALLAGAALGMAGALIQGVIRNPLASPDILGVTQGAGLALTATLLMISTGGTAWLPVVACLGGAVGASLLMLYNAGLQFSPVRFALSGVAVSLTFASITEFLLLTWPVEINTALLALVGSLWARGWTQLPQALPLIGLMLLALPLAKPLDLVGLGDQAASSLGVHLRRIRPVALGLAIMLTGLTVAVIGPLSFVGLVAPHLARRLVGGRHIRLLPASALVGAALVTFADTVGRGLIPPTEIAVGILTPVIGAPYFLWLLFRIR